MSMAYQSYNILMDDAQTLDVINSRPQGQSSE